MGYIAFIPARSGSRRIKNKNIINLNQKPLIYYTINAAKKSKFIKKIFVSTDSEKIKKISEIYNCNIDKLRPKYLAGDNVSMHKLLKKTIIMEKKQFKKFKYLVLLQPTSPLRTFKDIDNACKKFEKFKDKIDSLISTYKIKKILNIKKTMIGNKDFIIQLKKKNDKKSKKLYHRNGPAIIILKIKNIKKFLLGKKICNFEMSQKKSIDINYYKDLKQVKTTLGL